eukprot:826375_1
MSPTINSMIWKLFLVGIIQTTYGGIQPVTKEISFKSCADGPATASISQLLIDPFPYPVRHAGPMSIQIVGAISKNMTSGSYHVDAHEYGINVYSENGDACSKTTCPIIAGHMDLKLQVEIGSVPFSASPDIHVVVHSYSGELVFCVEFVLDIK